MTGYNYYISSWGGNIIPAPEFPALAAKAERYLRYVIGSELEYITAIKNAVCAAAEALYDCQQNIAPQKGIKSQSADGVSVTYSTLSPTSLQKMEETMMYRAIQKELCGTGLLYKGC